MLARTAVVVMLLSGCASSTDVDTGRVRDASRADAGPTDAGAPVDGGPGGDPCTADETDTCMTSCFTTGLRVCTAGFFGPCVPPAEDCNMMDDDCDGAIDEVTERGCSSECGGGTERCVAGAWTGCGAVMPRDEVCDGMDNDCDSRIDEDLTRPCATACGAGTETCVAGTWAACTGPRPRPETCDGTDEDCDGAVDEALTRACTTACGSGIETCAAGTFSGCTAPAPTAETCDGTDENCDGTTDEGFWSRRVVDSYGVLSGYAAACDGTTERFGAACNAAIHRRCAASMPCWTSGFGPVENSGSRVDVTCVIADVRTITFATAAAHHPACDGSGGSASSGCRAAANRYCRAEGFGGGYPAEDTAGGMRVACLRTAHAVGMSTTYTVLVTHHPGCDGAAQRIGPECSAAIHRLCTSMGFESGFGPVEQNLDDANVTCVRR